jgi:membrane-associated phospholipid phosphatase
MVAFAAAWVLCRLHPRASPVWLALAVGCAFTRLVSHAHLLSDVVVAAVAAYAVVWVVWRWEARLTGGPLEAR